MGNRLFAKTSIDKTISKVNLLTGVITRLGSATVKVNNEVVDNSALLDEWKLKEIMAGEWSIDVEQAVSDDMAEGEDLVKLAAAKTLISVVLRIQYGGAGGTGKVIYGGGSCYVESAENVIEGAIRQRATLVGTGTYTATGA